MHSIFMACICINFSGLNSKRQSLPTTCHLHAFDLNSSEMARFFWVIVFTATFLFTDASPSSSREISTRNSKRDDTLGSDLIQGMVNKGPLAVLNAAPRPIEIIFAYKKKIIEEIVKIVQYVVEKYTRVAITIANSVLDVVLTNLRVICDIVYGSVNSCPIKFNNHKPAKVVDPSSKPEKGTTSEPNENN